MKWFPILLAFYVFLLSSIPVIEKLVNIHLTCCVESTEVSCAASGCTEDHGADDPDSKKNHREKPCNPFHCIKCPVNLLIQPLVLNEPVAITKEHQTPSYHLLFADLHIDKIWHPPI